MTTNERFRRFNFILLGRILEPIERELPIIPTKVFSLDFSEPIKNLYDGKRNKKIPNGKDF